MAKYTEAQRIAALAALELSGGQIRKTARELGIPPGTLTLWRDQAASIETMPALYSDPLNTAQKSEQAAAQTKVYGARLGEALDLALDTLLEKLPGMAGRDVAIAVGILVDKHLDITQGRKGAQIIADNRSVNLQMPEGTTIEDIRSLRDQLQAGLTEKHASLD
jgi:transposase-like protein